MLITAQVRSGSRLCASNHLLLPSCHCCIQLCSFPSLPTCTIHSEVHNMAPHCFLHEISLLQELAHRKPQHSVHGRLLARRRGLHFFRSHDPWSSAVLLAHGRSLRKLAAHCYSYRLDGPGLPALHSGPWRQSKLNLDSYRRISREAQCVA